MGEKLVIGPISKGLNTYFTPFAIDNDSFPEILNAYQWRGRVKRKRGTSFLNRLQRLFVSTLTSFNPGSSSFNLIAGAGNILTGFTTLQTNASIVPGTSFIHDITAGNSYTDNSQGILTGTPAGTGTINYSTGEITIAGGGTDTIIASFVYYPSLPVMGLEDLILNPTQYPGTLGFDTTYSYNALTSYPFTFYDVSFYKNPPADATNLPGYVPKTTWTPTTWNGQNYQQFWTTNYQGALWSTNGLKSQPIDLTTIGMQFKGVTGVTIVTAGNGTTIPAIATLTIVAHGLVVGDFVFINEVVGITGINWQTGYVTTVVDANNVQVTFPFAILGGSYTSGGIAQYLTSRSNTSVDCLRWYDGDPTNGVPSSGVFEEGFGWVNFSPPLSQAPFSIGDAPSAIYYLVGAKNILQFKDRLIFFGPVIQSSSASPIYLQDSIVYSQNGTPYYTASYFNQPNSAVDTPTSSLNVFHPILVPKNQIATSPAYFEDSTGFGGYITSGVDQQIITVAPNEDVLIVGFNSLQTRLIYSGNDIVPFNFYIINSELGSGSTFSSIIMDKGVLSRGNRGFIVTSQTGASRIDLDAPDEIFEINLMNNGADRVTAQRDYIQEWIYFTYTSNMDNSTSIYPNQTFLYNYRDNSWSIFNETYTTYGQFRETSGGFTWATVGQTFPQWNQWDQPWNAGITNALQPVVIAGNQQGFILVRDEGTGESESLAIQSFSLSQITCPNHGLNEGDFIIINNCLGTIGAQVNGKIFQATNITTNTFNVIPNLTTGTYFGLGVVTRMYIPNIMTKQFPVAWDLARKTRLGPQQYLLTTTDNGEITLLIFLSQDSANAYNDGTIVPATSPELPVNNSLIYSTILYTCPESANLGLTPANINLQMVTASTQSQIWHRINTSLIGDTVQLGFTMNTSQMTEFSSTFVTYTITGITTQGYPTVITTNNSLQSGNMIQITDVVGMTQLNNNVNALNAVYQVISATSTTVTINVDSTSFSTYISAGTITVMEMPNQFEEIELHSIILDVSPSQLLA